MRKRTKNRKRPTARWGAAGAALLAGVCLAVQTQAARRPAGAACFPLQTAVWRVSLLDSLKNHLLLCRLDELPHLIDKSTLSVLVDFVGKALVDLHYIRRDFQQHAQRRVAGSKIIDGDAVAEFAKSGKTRL